MTIAVLLGDAQPLFSEALAVALQKDGAFFVLDGRPQSWPEAIEAVRLRLPDVVVLDYWLPETAQDEGELAAISRSAALESIAKAAPRSRLLLLSWSHGPSDIRRSLELGAVGFLPKSLGLKDLFEAIRRAHDGEPLVFADRLHNLYADIDKKVRERDEIAELLKTLTPQEMRILMLLLAGRSADDIAKELFISRATVNARVHKILSKTGTHSQAEALALCRRAGLVQE